MRIQASRANKRVKKGDIVQVMSGKAKGKSGKVTKIISKFNMCLVEKVNLVSKHTKSSQENPQGGILKIEAPIHLSNVKKMEGGSVGAKKKATTKKAADKKAIKKTAVKKTTKKTISKKKTTKKAIAKKD